MFQGVPLGPGRLPPRRPPWPSTSGWSGSVGADSCWHVHGLATRRCSWRCCRMFIVLPSASSQAGRSLESHERRSRSWATTSRQGYTSLEKEQSPPPRSRSGRSRWFKRWQQNRKARKLHRELEQRQQDEGRKELLLGRIARSGLELADRRRAAVPPAVQLPLPESLVAECRMTNDPPMTKGEPRTGSGGWCRYFVIGGSFVIREVPPLRGNGSDRAADAASGFRDYPPELMIPREAMSWRRPGEVYRSYGFAPIDTPALEYADDPAGQGRRRVNDRLVYRFKDHGDRDVALRFDLTVPFARFAAQHVGQARHPLQALCTWRRSGAARTTAHGRYREFMAVRLRHHRHHVQRRRHRDRSWSSTTSCVTALGFERFEIRRQQPAGSQRPARITGWAFWTRPVPLIAVAGQAAAKIRPGQGDRGDGLGRPASPPSRRSGRSLALAEARGT